MSKEVEDLRGGRKVLRGRELVVLELILICNLKEDLTFEREKCLGSSTIFEGVGVRILE